MFNPTITTPIFNIAQATSIALGASFLAKKATKFIIFIWDRSVRTDRQLNGEDKERYIKCVKAVVGLAVLILAAHEIFSARTTKSITALQTDLRTLEMQVSELSKVLSSTGVNVATALL